MMNGTAQMMNKPQTNVKLLTPKARGPEYPSPDKLLAALYHAWDGADRGALTMFFRGISAKQAIAQQELQSPVLTLGFRKAEYISGQGRIFKAFMEHENIQLREVKRLKGDYIEYDDNGAPVEIKLYDDNPTIMDCDPIVYKYETFKVPNPYQDFVDNYE